MKKKYLFIDRDGTLIVEPDDKQVDSLDKLNFIPGVFAALKRLSSLGYELVMVSNQDGLGTDSFPEADFEKPHQMMLKLLESQGIHFAAIHICPHFAADHCHCRKPELGLLQDYLVAQAIDKAHSYVIGDRQTDVELANRLGIAGIQIGSAETSDWDAIVDYIVNKPRCSELVRETSETSIKVWLNLDSVGKMDVSTGIAFLDHMLEQLIRHSGISAEIKVKGDLVVDDHHSVEDTAIALGEAIRCALGDKRGIGRYGFVLPMDESQATVSLDLSGRAFFHWDCEIKRDKIGGMAVEMIPHFFNSLAQSLQASLHIRVSGENAHHMIEGAFKAVGRCLRQAIKKDGDLIPSTKGAL